ncbi:MAG: hypothetical protein M3Y08_07260 [Fibrobacterota bacterium]|nr:hypothetical protein [Fibrobacterota bacterium]
MGKDTEKYLEKAIIRYKANHPAMHQTRYSRYDGKITAELKDALKKGENKREWFDGKAIKDAAALSHLRVEAMNYEDGEFGKTNKASKEKERMNRPLIPLEAEIMLVGKAGKPCAAPEGVGPVRVNWRFTDPPEDTSIQWPDEPANKGFPKKYLEKALKLKGGAANDNCHVDYGGIRVHPKTDFGPFMIGEFYLPHKVEPDKAQKLVFSKACIDKDKTPLRVGKAGVYFRPSNIAGDDYLLRAELDFTGLPNQADLEKDHNVTDEKSRIGADTGKFHIQRFHRLAVVVKWPGRTGSSEWAEISEEFAKAHVDFNTASLLNKPVADVLSLSPSARSSPRTCARNSPWASSYWSS